MRSSSSGTTITTPTTSGSIFIIDSNCIENNQAFHAVNKTVSHSHRAPTAAHTPVAAVVEEVVAVVAEMPSSTTSPRLPRRSFLAAADRPKVCPSPSMYVCMYVSSYDFFSLCYTL